MSEKLNQARLLMRILCALILLAPAFSHRPVLAAQQPAWQDEAFRLPDGSFAGICAEHAGDEALSGGHGAPGGDHERLAARLICDACLLVSAMLVPVPDDSSWLVSEFSFLENPLPDFLEFAGRVTVERPRSRSPPFAV